MQKVDKNSKDENKEQPIPEPSEDLEKAIKKGNPEQKDSNSPKINKFYLDEAILNIDIAEPKPIEVEFD